MLFVGADTLVLSTSLLFNYNAHGFLNYDLRKGYYNPTEFDTYMLVGDKISREVMIALVYFGFFLRFAALGVMCWLVSLCH